MHEDIYVGLIADLINNDSRPKERQRRVREANRVLYREVVGSRTTTTQADLALAKAAQKERDQ